ncbi:MAG: hypothetical protein LBS09_10105 [Bacteroidales bacterium]|nr:hypothetical protein [Bacteroidales bacterium]
MMSRRWNSFRIGLLLGIVLPLMIFLAFYLVAYVRVPLDEYLLYVVKMRSLPKILSLCAIPNLILFYIFLNKEYWYATRGVICATLLYTLGVVAVKIFL